jgi:hypothetical protein
LYVAGERMVVEAVLTLQHLCEEIERTLKIRLQEPTLSGRLREALNAAALAGPMQRPGYAKYVELAEIRDAIEHPIAKLITPGRRGSVSWSDSAVRSEWVS